ncbi:hypothetical protein [Vibrio mytili]|uniref:Fimbrial protein n=1 Tax=Vibrio mytili TaxID=50718 RepID=A0A0C3I9W7_9VIBR|nr:hypothetical protein [Vibrio mytili]KIN11790.1 hypothetical protein SU60_04475 [Vibrio mytili]
MKLSKLSLGIGMSLIFSSSAMAADPTATVDVFSVVEEKCNIGVVFGAGGEEAGVGATDLGNNVVDGEINDLNGGKVQLLTGYAECNSPGGFKILAKLENGALVNTTNDVYHIDYNLTFGSTNLDDIGSRALPGTGGDYKYETSEFLVGSNSATNDTVNFQLKMNGFDDSQGGIAGHYSEKVTYRVTTM